MATAAVERRRGTRRGIRGPAVSIGSTVVALVLVALIWWAVALLYDAPAILPTPASSLARLGELLGSDSRYSIVTNAAVSLRRVLIGWSIAVCAGVVVGSAMASNRVIGGLLDPLIEMGRPVPPLAFTPLLIIWFGIGELPKVLLIAFPAFFATAIATVASFRGVNENWRRAARTLGASRWHVLRKVTIPASLPGILVGVRIGSGMAWGTLVAAELIASTSGMGWMILQAGRYLDTRTIFAGIVVIAALAYLMDRVLRLIEAIVVPWRGRA
ncbi:MAG TPA: ABC transporter permease [Streptosporangiales bacterium]